MELLKLDGETRDAEKNGRGGRAEPADVCKCVDDVVSTLRMQTFSGTEVFINLSAPCSCFWLKTFVHVLEFCKADFETELPQMHLGKLKAILE